jgi:serine/threonine protein phosphatase PrpC
MIQDFKIRKLPPHGCAKGIKGKRESMEDETFYSSWVFGPWRIFVEFFGVLDGHGGATASKTVALALPRYVAMSMNGLSPAQIKEALLNGFSLMQVCEKELKKKIIH